MPAEKPKRDTAAAYRRDTFRQIVLPVLGGVLLLFIMLGTALLLGRRVQVSLITNLVFTALVLCPAALCFFPLAILMVVMAVGMNRVHDGLAGTLVRFESVSHGAADRVITSVGNVNEKSAELSEKLAPVNRLFGAFDDQDNDQGIDHDPDTTG